MAVNFQSFAVAKEKVSPITVEVEILNGFPDFNIIGLGDKSLREVKERSRAAIRNSGYKFPMKRKIVNLTPADLRKSGSHFDVPIILGILIRSGQLNYHPSTSTIFLGEVGLNGTIKHIPNIVKILENARLKGVKEAFIPQENRSEAKYVKGMRINTTSNLSELIQQLKTGKFTPIGYEKALYTQKSVEFEHPKFEDIVGNPIAKRALTIALAGYHNMLMIGSPGLGKSMLAESSKNLMQYLSNEEMAEFYNHNPEYTNSKESLRAPFSIIQSDFSKSKIQEQISKSSSGVVVLNELPEFSKNNIVFIKDVIDCKTPKSKMSYIATMNPCKCGYLFSKEKVCWCNSYNKQLFQQKIPGPLFDRFDLAIKVEDCTSDYGSTQLDETQKAFDLIEKVHLIQRERRVPNCIIPLKSFTDKNMFSPSAKAIFKMVENKYQPSLRRLNKMAGLARTIADLEQSPVIEDRHMAESFSLQKLLYHPYNDC